MEESTDLMSVPPSIETNAEVRELFEFFHRLAGDDLELDCWELQKMLTFALKKGKFYKKTFEMILASLHLALAFDILSLPELILLN